MKSSVSKFQVAVATGEAGCRPFNWTCSRSPDADRLRPKRVFMDAGRTPNASLSELNITTNYNKRAYLS